MTLAGHLRIAGRTGDTELIRGAGELVSAITKRGITGFVADTAR